MLDTTSNIMDRMIGDCEVSYSTKRHPILIITDGHTWSITWYIKLK